MQQRDSSGQVFLLGGNELKFLVEEPLRVKFRGLQLRSLKDMRELEEVVENADAQQIPCCLLASAETPSTDPLAWATEHRARWPSVPIVILNRPKCSVSPDHFFPQLHESVAVVNYPYTQMAVVNAIENAIWWSRNLYRMSSRTDKFKELSEREMAIVSMAADGVPNKTMARRLAVSIKTIEKNRRIAYEKLQVSSAAEMAALVTFRRYFCRLAEKQTREATSIKKAKFPTQAAIRANQSWHFTTAGE